MAKAQTDYPGVYHQSFKARHLLLDSVIDPAARKLGGEGYLAQMDLIQKEARRQKDPALELAIYQYKYNFLEDHKRITPDEKIAKLKGVLQGLDQRKYPEYAVLFMWDIAANYFGKKHNYTLAFDYYTRAAKIARALSSTEFPSKKGLLVTLGNGYYKLGDLERSKAYLQEADTIAFIWKADHLTEYNAHNTLGLVYRSSGKMDSAILCFQKTHLLALQQKDSVWMAIALGNIGIAHYLAGNYPAAIPLLYEDVKYCFWPNRHAIDNGMNSLLILADIHLKMDSIGCVASDIALANKYIDSCLDKVKPFSMYYSVLARYLSTQGKYKEAYFAQDSAAKYKDSLARRDNIYQLAKLEHIRDLEKHETELQKINAEKRLVVFTRNGLVVGILLLSVIALLGISRQRARHKIKSEELKNKNDLAEKELQDATRQLENYTQYLQEKNELIERAGIEIQKLQEKVSDKESFYINNDVLQKLYSSTILTDDEWNDFKSLFEQVHRGYLQWLKDKIPDLTPSDTRFLVLNKLKLSNKEMAGILGVQPDTIRSYKHRLKKRFDLAEDAEVKSLIVELLDKSQSPDNFN